MTTKGNVGVHNVVPTVYDGVINEVISSVKDDFINEGLDESVLEELKKLWKKKLHESRALEDPQEKKKVMYVYMPNKEGGHSGMVQKHTTPVYRQISRPQVQMVTSGQRVVHQQRQGGYPAQRVIRTVQQPNDGSGQQQRITRIIQVPNNSSHDHRAQPSIQRNIQRVVLPAQSNQQGNHHIKPSVIQQNNQIIRTAPTSYKQHNTNPHIPSQYDGNNLHDSSSSGSELEESEPEETPNASQYDEPLGPDDDDEDDKDDAAVFDTDNMIVCQFDKIQRVRNKWRFYLKDGIMHLNGKDYVFQKATGEGEW